MYVFNFDPEHSAANFFLPVHSVGEGRYRAVFSTDEINYGGMDRISEEYVYHTRAVENKGIGFEVYIPCRTAVVFKKID